MRNVTRRQLRVFAAVVAEQGFSGAARQLHLTQPAVSLQVKELERACGVPLLERAGRQIRPTEAGREVLRAAHGVEREMKAAEEALDALRGLRGGTLTVAVISTAQYFGPRLLARFREVHPGVSLRLHVCNRVEIVRRLQDDAIDIALMGRPPSEIETAATAFAPNAYVAVAAPAHPLVGKRRIKVPRLLEEPFIAREAGSGTRQLADLLFSRHVPAFAPQLVMSSNEAIKQAVMAGMAISLLSFHTVGNEVATGALEVLDVDGLPLVRRWYIVHRADKRLSPATAAFRDFMRGQAGALVAGYMAPAMKVARLRHRLLDATRGAPGG